MRDPESQQQLDSLYIGKRFYKLTIAEIGLLPDGIVLRKCPWIFKPTASVIIDASTRQVLMEENDTRAGLSAYGFLEGDNIPSQVSEVSSRPPYLIDQVAWK